MANGKYTTSEFASIIRDKYNSYQDIDDDTLVEKWLEKYPVYSEKIDFSEEITQPEVQEADEVDVIQDQPKPIELEVIETPKEEFDINSKEGQEFIKQYSKNLKNKYNTSFETIKSDASLSPEERKSKYKAELDNYKKDLEEFESAIFEAQKNFDIPVAFAQGWMGTGKGLLETVKMPAAQGIDLALRLFDPETSKDPEKRAKIMNYHMDKIDNFLKIDEIENAIRGLDQYRYKPGKGVVDTFKEDGVPGAVRKIVAGMAESSPSLVAAATGPIGLTIFGTSVIGNTFADKIEESPDANINRMLLNSEIVGGIEVGGELITRGILKSAGLIGAKQGKDAAKEFARDAYIDFLKRFGVAPVGSAAEESFTRLVTDFADYAIDPNVEWNWEETKKGMIDEGLIGWGTGTGIAGTGALKSSNRAVKEASELMLMPSVDKQKIGKLANEANKIFYEYQDANETDKNTYEQRLSSIYNDIASIKRQNRNNLSFMNQTELKEYGSNIDEINKLSEEISKNLDEDNIKYNTDQIKKLQYNNQSLLNNAKQRAFDNKANLLKEQGNVVLEANDALRVDEAIKEIEKETGIEVDRSQIETNPANFEFEVFNDGNIEDISKKYNIPVDMLQGDTEGTYLPEKGIILMSEQAADGVLEHEGLHAFLDIGLNKAGNENLVFSMAESVKKEIEKINPEIGRILDSQIEKYKQDKSFSAKDIAEEVLAYYIQFRKQGLLEKQDNVLKKASNSIKNIFTNLGFNKNININENNVVYLLDDYLNSLQRGKLNKQQLEFAKGNFKVSPELIQRGEEIAREQEVDTKDVKDIVKKESKKLPSEVVQDIYNKQGVAGALDIIQEFKPIVSKIVERRREAPGFDRQLLTDEIETGERGILDLIQAYNPESGVPLAAYINKFLPSRAIEASQRVLGEVFESDIAERVDIAEPTTEVEEIEITEKPKAPTNLRRALDIKEGGDLYNKVKDVVAKTFGTRIPEVTDPKFKKTLQDTYATELTNDVKELMGKPSSDKYKTFLQKYGEQIYDLIPQDILNKSYQDFIVEEKKNLSPTEVDDAISKGLLPSDTPRTAGPSLFSKKPYNQEEFVEFHLAPKKGRPASKQTQLAQTIAKELGKDATLEVLEDPKVFERFTEVQEIEGKKVTKETKPKVAEKIQREPGVKFAKKINENDVKKLIELSVLRSINDATKKIGIDSKVTVTDDNRSTIQNKILKAFESGGLGLTAFESMMPASAGAKSIRKSNGDKYYKLSNGKEILGQRVKDEKGKQLKDTKGKKRFKPPTIEQITEKHGEGVTLVPDGGRIYYGVTDPAYIKAKEAAVKNDPVNEYQRIPVGKEPIGKAWLNKKNRKKLTPREQGKINFKAFKQAMLEIEKSVKDGNMDIETAALMIAQGYQATAGIIKGVAEFKYRSRNMEFAKTGKQKSGRVAFREEHNPPASVIGAYLIWAIKNGKVEALMPYIKKNYYQTQLSLADDLLLDLAKLDATLPEGTSILDNPIIRFAVAGINLNTILNIETDRSIVDEFGLSVPLFFEYFPGVIAFQNNLVKQVIFEGLDIKQAKKQLDQYLKIAPQQQEAIKFSKSILDDSKVLNLEGNLSMEDLLSKAVTLDNALANARKLDAPVKKIRVFDFDDTLAQTKSIVFYTKPDGTEGQLTAEEFAEKGADLVAEGAVMDFSDFNIVREGERGPLFDVAKKIRDARGNEDLFVLTARAPESVDAIYEFLKSEGLEFKRENIVGLGNSTGAAKANWVVDKAAEGYNDFYFADDAYANVQAVQDALDQIDVKSKVQQAKIKFSKSINEDFNKIIEQKTGIASEKRYSKAKAKVRGAGKGNKKFFIPYSAEDFMGLIYPLLSKGTLGDSQMAWFKEHVLDPYGRAIENLSSDRIQMMQDFKELKKSLDVPKDLRKTNESGFTNEQAVRVYLFNKVGHDVPGLSKTDLKELIDIVNSDGKLKAFADQILSVTKGDGYVKPAQEWLAGTITTDLIDLLNTTKRKKYLEQSGYLDNANEIFSEENLNKLEAAYGANYREAMENSLARMKSGKNRMFSGNRLSNRVLDYINGSIGTIMFFNTRSAILQTISAVNFLNWSFNNPYKAGKAFANQVQYWKDFKTLMNSDYLTDRRNGLKLNISENEIANAAATAKNKARGAMNYILQKGYLPTQFADSFAIASGGATFYRNRINDLVSKGMDIKEAEKQALSEWKETAEISQQSSDPSKISQQQASDLGRVILAFANTPMQYARIQKRAFQDLANRRGDAKANVSKIIYYGVVQNLIFNALQQAVFALGFGDDEDDDKKQEKYLDTANGMLDSTLRGLGIAGATVSIIKNFLLDVYERSGRKRPEYVDSIYELLRLSPPIYSKISKLRQAAWQFDSKKRRAEIFEKGFSIDNPAYEAGAKVISATTNLPLDRVLNKINNIEAALGEDPEVWQRVAMLAGWPEWQIMPKNYKNKEELPKFPGKKIKFKKGIQFK